MSHHPSPPRRRVCPRPRRAPPLTGRALLAFAGALALATFLVRLWLPARGTEPFDLHLWQWPQLAAMFWLGTSQASTGLAAWVPHRLYRGCGGAVGAIVGAVLVLAATLGTSDVTAVADAYLGGWSWQALLLAVVEAGLVVAGSLWLLGFAQRRTARPGRRSWQAVVRGSFVAFVVQGPVLVLLAVVLRGLPWPAEIKAPLVVIAGVAACFAIGWVFPNRRRKSHQTGFFGPASHRATGEG